MSQLPDTGEFARATAPARKRMADRIVDRKSGGGPDSLRAGRVQKENPAWAGGALEVFLDCLPGSGRRGHPSPAGGPYLGIGSPAPRQINIS